MQSSSRLNIFFILISLFALLIALVYQPLPDDFPQPWKYRFLSYGAGRIDQIVCKRIVREKNKIKIS
jgi:hypothetical protein